MRPPIPGDLVYTATYPCCNAALGYTGKLLRVRHDDRICHCGVPLPTGPFGIVEDPEYPLGVHIPYGWLRRIPPLEKEDEELRMNVLREID